MANVEENGKIQLVDNIGNYYGTIARLSPEHPVLVFSGYGHEILRLEPNGDIYVKNELVENDKDVVHGLRMFLASQGF